MLQHGMKNAVNYSPQAAELLSNGTIDVELLKCSPDFPELISEAMALRPVRVHFSFYAGKPQQSPPDKKMIETLLRKTGTTFVNIHLLSTNEDFPDIPIDADRESDRQRVVEHMVNDVRAMTEYFKPDQVILENLPYHSLARVPSVTSIDVLRVSVLPSTIRTVIEETGCGLLLDIDHARVAAHYLQEDPKEYIQSLPVDRIRELHMTGTAMQDGWLQSHLPMQEADWEFFEWALQNIADHTWSHPEMMAFEYGGVGKAFLSRSDPEVIANQVPQFLRMIELYQL